MEEEQVREQPPPPDDGKALLLFRVSVLECFGVEKDLEIQWSMDLDPNPVSVV
jgi:hypothetical protein